MTPRWEYVGRVRHATALLALLCLAGCQPEDGPTYEWNLPAGFPTPPVPDDNPMSVEKVELGRYLFYDPRVSGNQTYSCGSCHRQELSFTDALPVAVGSTGSNTPRGSMSLANAAYHPRYTWANPVVSQLEDQALVPMFGDTPVELGTPDEPELVARFSSDPMYLDLFSAAYPDDADPITLGNIVRAIACFERALISGDSPYDRYTYQFDDAAMSESARRGLELFNTERLECFHCHGGFNFTDSLRQDRSVMDEVAFHNTALYNIDGRGGYPEPNRGIFEFTGDRRDMGRFRSPSLRNITVTAPYMHDGSIETLDGVLDHYAAGGRTITEGPYVGVGSESPLKNLFIHGFTLTDEERADVMALLSALTDETFLTDPRFSDPFE
ncbi:MAG: di-heme enzyme [Sandaracinaceae bacterium]|nr:di-heme enzyme [Sandaracinaceae bacterium]